MVQNIDSYIAIIGDIRNSKKIKDREDVQVKLRNTLGSINDKYAQDMLPGLQLPWGMSFRGCCLTGRISCPLLPRLKGRCILQKSGSV